MNLFWHLCMCPSVSFGGQSPAPLFLAKLRPEKQGREIRGIVKRLISLADKGGQNSRGKCQNLFRGYGLE